MGRVTDPRNNRVRRKKRRELQKIRHDALAAKRKSKKDTTQKGKASLPNVLKKFANMREKIDNITHGGDDGDKKGPKIINDVLLPNVGLFRKGYKGDEIKSKVFIKNKTKQARLDGNFLHLMNGNEEKAKKFSTELHKIITAESENQLEKYVESSVVSPSIFTQAPTRDTDITSDQTDFANKGNKTKPRIFDSLFAAKEKEGDNSSDTHLLRFTPPPQRNARLNVEKDINIESQIQLSGSPMCEQNIPYSKMLCLKELSTNLVRKTFAGFQVPSQLDPYITTKEFLKKTCIKNISTSYKTLQAATGWQQTCSGTTTQSIIYDAIFPELRDSQRHSDEASSSNEFRLFEKSQSSQKMQNRRKRESSSSSSSASARKFSPTSTPFAAFVQTKSRIRLPTTMFQKNTKQAYFTHNNLGITPEDRIQMDMHFSTHSLKAMSLESEDEEAAPATFGKQVPRGNKRQQPKSRAFSPCVMHYAEKPDGNVTAKEFHFLERTHKVDSYNKANVNERDVRNTRKCSQHFHQSKPKESHDFSHVQKSHSHSSNVPQCSECKPAKYRSSEERSGSRSDEQRYASRSKLSSGEEQENLPQRSLSKEMSYRHKYNNSHMAPVPHSQQSHDRFLNQVLPANMKESEDMKIVVVMAPVVHMVSGDAHQAAEMIQRRACPMLSQAACRPVRFLSQGFEKNPPQAAVLSEYVESSMSQMSQPAKFVALEEDEHRKVKKPIYLSQEDDQSRKKSGRMSSWNNQRSDCFSRTTSMRDNQNSRCHHRHRDDQRDDYELRSQERSKNRFSCEQLKCCYHQDCCHQDCRKVSPDSDNERSVRKSKRKQCSQTKERPRCCGQDHHRHMV